MFTKKTKRYLMLLAALGLIAIAAGSSGTFASFDAVVTNNNNTFATGTLFLHETPDGGTTCTSEGTGYSGGNTTNHATCTALFSEDLSAGAKTVNLAIANAGTLAASDIKFGVGSCGWAKTDNAEPTFIAVPSDCSNLYVTIEEETDNTYAPAVYCAYGPAATSCGAPTSTYSLADGAITGGNFATLKTTSAATATLTAKNGAKDTRYYSITIDPSVAGGNNNSLQNLTATFSLSWKIDE